MLDIQFIRKNGKLVQEKSQQKGIKVDINKLLDFDKKRRELIGEIEGLRAKRNEISGNKKPNEKDISEGKKIKESVVLSEKKLSKVETEYNKLLKTVPNIPSDDVPVGLKEDDNKVIKTVGHKPDFNFKPKTHGEIGEKLGIIDKQRAAKVAGSRFAYILGDLVRLHFAQIQFGLDVVTNEKILEKIAKDNKLNVSTKAFTPVLPPAMANTKAFEATGRLNKEEQTYKLADEDLWLNASAEHTLAPMHMNEIIEEQDLPLRYVGYTTAFRREAGTYGKDTEGIFRLHQFDKLEMESFVHPDKSYDEHLFMIAIQEYLMQQLKLPYQVVLKCTGEIGGPNARGVDIEAWLPGQNQYRETHTADYITDYQSRRMKTKYRSQDNSTNLLHTCDGTVFSQRPLIAIIENYQTKDGNFEVPEVLKKYINHD